MYKVMQIDFFCKKCIFETLFSLKILVSLLQNQGCEGRFFS